MHQRRVIVLKFGGSALRDERSLPRAVAEVDRWRREGYAVVAVVSALHGQTDRLLAEAHRHAERPEPGALAALVATGEQAAAAALALVLDRAGVGARAFDAASAGLRTTGDPLDSHLVSARAEALCAAFALDQVAVVPGFVGRDAQGRTTLLGRGGSDYTALFLASCLGARCRLVKDVPGVFDRDPGAAGARRLAAVSWADAEVLGGRVLQPKALRFAAERRLSFEVAALDADDRTVVGPGPTRTGGQPTQTAPLRVACLGAGVVGLGVLQHLLARPEQFEVVGVAVRDPAAAVARGAPCQHVTTDGGALARSECDVVFEALGGAEPAASWLEAAFERGRRVVTVNKSAVSRSRDRLERAAQEGGGTLTCSGAVGGATPVLARAARLREERGVVAVEAVLNGTTNFVLDRIAEGSTLADAVREAQERGFAEADPTTDLDGTDSAEKLSILAGEAFGVSIAPEDVERHGVFGVDAALSAAAHDRGKTVRLVASLRRTGAGLEAVVAPREVAADGWLGGVREEWNAAAFRCEDGSTVRVRGRGAGRWPTAQAALADLLALRRRATDAAPIVATAPVEAGAAL